MAVRTRVEPIDKDIDLIIRKDLSPEALSATLAQFAFEEIEEAKEINRRSIGVVPPYTVWVDGKKGAPLASVKPDGIIIAEFELVQELLSWIHEQLQKHSPVKSGLYARSHELFADGVQVENPNDAPQADEYVFLNTQRYARKIERGASAMAPQGVFQVVAKLAQGKFGNVARTTFTFRTVISGMMIGGRAGDRSTERTPAILVRLRT